MNTVNQIGPWITLISFGSLIVFFGIFYIVRYLQESKSTKTFNAGKAKTYNTPIHKGKIKTALSK